MYAKKHLTMLRLFSDKIIMMAPQNRKRPREEDSAEQELSGEAEV